MPTINREALEQPFPEGLVRSRKGPFGKSFSYVEGSEYIRRLNEALEGGWSFEIIEHHRFDSEVVVLGRLTAGNVVKCAFGGSSITVSRDGEVISVADDLKSAATDALKKAASLMGVGLHLYSSDRPAEAACPGNGPSKGNDRPRQDGNGRGNGNGQRQSVSGTNNGNRITQRQLSAVWGMARSLGLSADEIRERTVQAFGTQPEHMSKSDASSFITELSEGLSGSAS